MSVLTHTHIHKHRFLKKIVVANSNHQVNSPFTCGLMSALVVCTREH